jgi:hypothetical protein
VKMPTVPHSGSKMVLTESHRDPMAENNPLILYLSPRDFVVAYYYRQFSNKNGGRASLPPQVFCAVRLMEDHLP